MDEKNQLVIYEKAKAFVPALMRAARMSDNDKMELAKKEDLLLKVFRVIDMKKSELEIAEQARSLVICKKEVIKRKDGTETTVEKIVQSHNISFLIKQLGRDDVVFIIRMLLFNLNESFNRKDKLSTMMIKETAEDIIEIFGKKLFMEELIYIFKKAKVSAMVYKGLDENMILRWIDEYYENLMSEKLKRHETVKHSSYVPTYEMDLVKKFTIVPEKVKQAHLDRDMKAAGIDTTKPATKSKWKPKNKK